MTRVLVGGVFDLFHKGHEHFLREAKKLGDELIVVITTDKHAKKKGIHENQKTRARKVRESGIPDKVIIGYEGKNYMRIVKEVKPDIIALGYDQKLPVPKREVEKFGIKVVRIESKVEGISSTILRRQRNIKVIGTSHISPESISEIKKTIEREMPDCVAVELDPGRFEALRRGETIKLSAAKEIGFKNYIIAKFLSVLQRYLGKKTGVIPGEEMLTAVNSAIKVKADVAFIDQDIRITLQKLGKVPLSEKFRIFLSLFKKIKIKSESFNLNEVPDEELVEILLKSVKETSPTLYRVLVEERNDYMANALKSLCRRYEKIVAVVGMGHKREILKRLKLNP